MEEAVSFGTVDYIMMAVMLMLSLAIGVFFAISGGRRTTQVEYLLGGRKLGALPVCLSLFATFNSAISLLGIPADVYSYGTMAIYISASISLANLACLWTLLPLVYPLKVTSVYEYLQLRFESKAVRLMGAGMGMFSNIAYMTIALLSPALALQTAAGLPLWISLLAVGCVGTVYTAIGGIKSVVWTDAFQTVVIFGGILATLIKGSIDVGGASNIWARTEEKGRLIFDEFDTDPRVRHTVWGTLIGSTFYWMSVNFSQSFSQRLCATKSEKDAKTVILLVAPLNIIYGAILVFTGMTILVYFDFIGCDPLAAGYIKNPNQLMPYFVIRTLGFIPGLSGLYISTIFSGALSTLSSGINSLAANTVEDILQPVLRNSQESTVTAISKLIVALYGCGIIGLAYLVKEVKGPVTQIMYTALGASGGPVFGLFLLGGIFPQANKVGASFGCIAGLVFSLWLNISKMLYGSGSPSLPPGSTDTCWNDTTVANMTVAAEWMNGTETFSTLTSSYDKMFSNLTSETDMVGYTTVTDLRDSTSGIPIDDNQFGSVDPGFNMYDCSYVWLPLLGTLMSVITGVAASLLYELSSGSRKRPKPEYLFPFIRRFCDTTTTHEEDEVGMAFIVDENHNK